MKEEGFALECYKAGIQTGKSFAIQQTERNNIYSWTISKCCYQKIKVLSVYLIDIIRSFWLSMNLSLGLLMRSSLPITGQWFLCEYPGPKNYCCILGQTAAAVQIFWVFYLCTKHWLSVSAGGISVSYNGTALIFCFWGNLGLPLRYWLPNWPCTNLTVQEAASHSMSLFALLDIPLCWYHSSIAAYRTWKLVQNNLLSLVGLTVDNVGYAFYQLCYGLTGLLTFESLCKHLGETQ